MKNNGTLKDVQIIIMAAGWGISSNQPTIQILMCVIAGLSALSILFANK